MSLQPLRTALATWVPKVGRGSDPLQNIAAAWPTIVGHDVATHCTPVAVDGSTLVIVTKSATWSQQLQLLTLEICAKIEAHRPGLGIERLRFRTGRVRASDRGAGQLLRVRGSGPESPARRRSDGDDPLRPICRRCGARRGTEGGTDWDDHCAPCRGARDEERRNALARLLYLAPWLGFDDVRRTLPDVTPEAFEAGRRTLLQRWWLTLERARRAGRLSPSGLERRVASSYVLLASRLPPDAITPAIVRNLIGVELERILWPPALPVDGTPPSKVRRR